jgi:hypothetical protein
MFFRDNISMPTTFFGLEKRRESFPPMRNECFDPFYKLEEVGDDELYQFMLSRLASRQIMDMKDYLPEQRKENSKHPTELTDRDIELKETLLMNLYEYKGLLVPTKAGDKVYIKVKLPDY